MYYEESTVGRDTLRQPQTYLIYAWGKNEQGELGLQTTKNIKEPRPLKTAVGYPMQISSAHSHTGLINNEGLLQMTGSQLHNKLMLGLKVTNVLKFYVQPALQSVPIKQIACGAYHTLALAESGELFSWGGTLWGKTGQKSGRVNKVHTLFSKVIIQIACGDFHSMVLTAQGEAYTWGGGGQSKNKGQLGHSNFKDVETPEVVRFLQDKPIVKIACGDYFSMVVTSKNELYSWGEGLYGQLGYGNEETHTPKLVPFIRSQEDDRASSTDQIEQLSLGGKHTMVLMTSGSLYVCGSGSQGQLGLGQGKVENKDTLVYCSAFRGVGISMISSGSNHSMVLTDEHNVYVCGYNHLGQLGTGDLKSKTIWIHVKSLAGKKVGRIYSGGNHSWAVLDRVRPIIQNYNLPEPLNYLNDQNIGGDLSMMSRSIARSHSSYFPAFEESPELNYPSRFNLQIIYTSVELCHRFIKFTSKVESKQFHANVSEYLSYCVDIEKSNLKHHRLTLDKELLSEDGRVVHPGSSKGYTIMMVCGVNDSIDFKGKTDQSVIGNKTVVTEKDLHNGKYEKSYRWFFKFNSLFDGMLSKAKIIELRPSNQ